MMMFRMVLVDISIQTEITTKENGRMVVPMVLEYLKILEVRSIGVNGETTKNLEWEMKSGSMDRRILENTLIA